MNRSRACIVAVCAVAALALCVTAPATAMSDDGSARAVESCLTIDQPGHYTLSQDVSNNETCIRITASDVVFDGHGHTVTGTETTNDSRIDIKAGIHVDGTETLLENVSVRNVTLTGWGWNSFGNNGGAVRYDSVLGGSIAAVDIDFGDRGVWLRNASQLTVEGVVSDDTKKESLFLRNGADNNTITRIRIGGTEGRAVRYMNSDYNAFENNTVLNAGSFKDEGVRLAFGSDWNTFRNNTISSGSGAGIGVGGGSNLVIEDNDISANNGAGVYLSQSGENYSVADNTLDGNNAGIYTSYMSNATIRDNTVTRSTENNGVNIYKSSGVVVDGNTIRLSERYGINVRHPADPDGGGIVVTNNRVNRSNEVGIRLDVTERNTVANNTIVNAPEPGLFSPPVGLLLTNADNNTLRDNTIQNSWGAINVTDGSENNTLEDHTVRNTVSGKWLTRINDSMGNVVESIDVGNSTAPGTVGSFSGQNVSVELTESAPANPSATGIGRYVNVSDTVAPGSIELTLHYEASDLSAVEESKLKLWRHDGSEWTPVVRSVLDTEGNTVTASVDASPDGQTFGLFELPYDTGAAFSLPGGSIEPGSNVTFDAGDSTGDIVRYEWDFDGDGTVDSGTQRPTVDHTFATVGNASVTLFVTDSDGNQDAVTETVTVAETVPSIPGSRTHRRISTVMTCSKTSTGTAREPCSTRWRTTTAATATRSGLALSSSTSTATAGPAPSSTRWHCTTREPDTAGCNFVTIFGTRSAGILDRRTAGSMRSTGSAGPNTGAPRPDDQHRSTVPADSTCSGGACRWTFETVALKRRCSGRARPVAHHTTLKLKCTRS